MDVPRNLIRQFDQRATPGRAHGRLDCLAGPPGLTGSAYREFAERVKS